MNPDDKENLYKLRHSAEHVFAQAVTELYPGKVQLGVAHISDDGFSNDANGRAIVRKRLSQNRKENAGDYKSRFTYF